jgi:peptide/nickel transport system permease protein
MRQITRTLLRHPGGLIGVVILAVAIAVAVFGPTLFPTSPWRMVQRPFLPPFTFVKVPLGTDALESFAPGAPVALEFAPEHLRVFAGA